jgi:hypothetical protein
LKAPFFYGVFIINCGSWSVQAQVTNHAASMQEYASSRVQEIELKKGRKLKYAPVGRSHFFIFLTYTHLHAHIFALPHTLQIRLVIAIHRIEEWQTPRSTT